MFNAEGEMEKEVSRREAAVVAAAREFVAKKAAFSAFCDQDEESRALADNLPDSERPAIQYIDSLIALKDAVASLEKLTGQERQA